MFIVWEDKHTLRIIICSDHVESLLRLLQGVRECFHIGHVESLAT